MSVIRRATGFLTPSELEILQQYSPVSLTMDSKTPSGIPIFSDILKKEARQLGLNSDLDAKIDESVKFVENEAIQL